MRNGGGSHPGPDPEVIISKIRMKKLRTKLVLIFLRTISPQREASHHNSELEALKRGVNQQKNEEKTEEGVVATGNPRFPLGIRVYMMFVVVYVDNPLRSPTTKESTTSTGEATTNGGCEGSGCAATAKMSHLVGGEMSTACTSHNTIVIGGITSKISCSCGSNFSTGLMVLR